MSDTHRAKNNYDNCNMLIVICYIIITTLFSYPHKQIA